MSDRRIRELERRAAVGDPQAAEALRRSTMRAGLGRDPRRDPRPGDIVRVAMHGAEGLERWDERVVEPSGRPPAFQGVYWRRTEESWRDLYRWGLARDRCGAMENLASWRRWARNGEVVRVTDGG